MNLLGELAAKDSLITAQAARIAELGAENSNLRYELNAALSGGTVSVPAAASAPVVEQALDSSLISILIDASQDGNTYPKSDYMRWCKRAADALSTALQASVREVPEVNDAKYSEAEKAIGKIIFERYPRIKGAHCASITIGILEYIGLRHSALNYDQQERVDE